MNQHIGLLRLGFEELVVAIGIAGYQDNANKLLSINLDTTNVDENRGRLFAATHSLISKELVVLEKDTPRLQEDFRYLIEIINNYDFSVRLNLNVNKLENILAFYYLKSKIIQQEILPGSVYQFSWVTEPDQIIQQGLDFLKINECNDFDCPESEIQQSVLEEAKKKAATQPETILEYFKNNDIPDETARLLNDDFIHTSFRGSVMRVEKRDGKIISDRGFLVMVHKPRAWLFPIFLKDNVPYVNIIPGTEASFKKEAFALLD
jgi:hypothetical protein